MASTYIYSFTMFKQGPVKENIPLFGFDAGDPGDNQADWASYEAHDVGDLSNFQYGAKDNRGMTLAMPIPIAMEHFGLGAQYSAIWIFASKDSDPAHVLETLQFGAITVTHRRHIPKGTFTVSGSQYISIPKHGGLAMFTPEAVTLNFT